MTCVHLLVRSRKMLKHFQFRLFLYGENDTFELHLKFFVEHFRIGEIIEIYTELLSGKAHV